MDMGGKKPSFAEFASKKEPKAQDLVGESLEGPKEEAAESSGESSAEEQAAFEELKAALLGSDAKTGAMALKNFLKECGY